MHGYVAVVLAGLALAACGGGDAAPDARAPDAALDATPDAPPACRVAGTPAAVGVVMDIGSTELSGLAASRTLPDLLWTHGDSGGAARVYTVDALTAEPAGSLRLVDAVATDWEDIAVGPCPGGQCIFLSDTGDNDLVRTQVSIVRVAEPISRPAGAVDVSWQRYSFGYPDGPHNVESLFLDPRDGAAYVVTKVQGAPAVVYRVPLDPANVATAVQVGALTIAAPDTRVTAADLRVDACGLRLLVRAHATLYELDAAPDATIEELLASPLLARPVADEPQGEAVAWAPDGSAYYTISEGANPTLWRTLEQ